MRRGLNVLITNQRTLDEVYAAIELIGGALGEGAAAVTMAADLRRDLEGLRPPSTSSCPRVFFEEWDAPLISGIAWVSDLTALCGGEDVYPELRAARSAPERIVEPGDVVRRQPAVIVASWCGKKAQLDRIAARPGWQDVPAVRHGYVHEIKSADILQPGPSLVHGARQLAAFIAHAAR